MIRGELSEMQRDAAWEGISPTERERTTALNLSMGGEENANAAGIIATANGAVRSAFEGREAERERERRRQLSDAALRAAERIAEIDRQLAGLYEERDRILEDIRDTQRRMDALRDGVRQIEENGDLERNEDGTLRNRALEAQLRAYERRTGRPVDRNDPETLLLALREQLDHERGAMDQHREREQENEDRIRELEGQRAARQRDLDNAQAGPDVSSAESRVARADNTALVRSADLELSDLDEAQEDEFDDLLAGIDDVALTEGDYPSYADEVDPDGAAQNDEVEEAPEQDHAQRDHQPDPLGPRMGG